MKKEVIGEAIPHNAVEVRVSTRNEKEENWMQISFSGVVSDPVVLILLQRALASNGHFSTFFDEEFESFTLDGNKIDIRDNWSRPRFWVQESTNGDKQAVMSFQCWGTPMVAESIAEKFEIYLHNIEGTYCYVVPQ